MNMLANGLPVLVASALFALAVDFVIRFCIPASKVNRTLTRIGSSLSHPKLRVKQSIGVDLASLIGAAFYDTPFARAWNEYAKTLHPQQVRDNTWATDTVRYRATALAEVFFTPQALVDSPLNTEFFTHLPGMLTGIGIIGTFTGLIDGLRNFLPSLDPGQLQESLSALIAAVLIAFMTSATAIVLAILVTLIERLVLNSCYRKVEQIQQAIDKMFWPGAGEEYLARLATASEAVLLRDAPPPSTLLADLKQFLTDLISTQTELAARNYRDLFSHFAEQINTLHADSANSILTARHHTTVTEGGDVKAIVADTPADVWRELDRLLIDRIAGISEQLTTISQALNNAATTLEPLSAAVLASLTTAGNPAAQRREGASFEARSGQDFIQHQLQPFVERLEELFARQNSQAIEKQMALLSTLRDQMGVNDRVVLEQVKLFTQQLSKDAALLSDKSILLASSLSREITTMVHQSGETNEWLKRAMETIAVSSQNAVARMAESLNTASVDFSKAAAHVSSTVNRTTDTFDRMQEVTLSVASSMKTLSEIVSDYRVRSEAFTETARELRLILETTKREASLTAPLVERMLEAATQLATAEKQAGTYLTQINQVLARAHASFVENIDKSLSHANHRFHEEINKATALLAANILDLEHAIDISQIGSR